jgi:cell wall-associated NlpC family hydrolase
MADEQFSWGMSVGIQEIEVGDLVFFTTYEPGPSHVGIYMGNGNFIHASSAADQVIVTSLNKPYYQARFLGARRLIR